MPIITKAAINTIENFMHLAEVQEAVDDVNIQRENLKTVTLIHLVVSQAGVQGQEFRLRPTRSGRGFTLEKRAHGGWNQWDGFDSFEHQTEGITALFKQAVEAAGYDPGQLPEAYPGPEFDEEQATQGGAFV